MSLFIVRVPSGHDWIVEAKSASAALKSWPSDAERSSGVVDEPTVQEVRVALETGNANPSKATLENWLAKHDPEDRRGRAQKALASRSLTRLSADEWTYLADETRRWYVVDSDDLAKLSDHLDEHEGNAWLAYSRWCADLSVSSKEMPEDWTPDAD